jgi:hypothetical protein
LTLSILDSFFIFKLLNFQKIFVHKIGHYVVENTGDTYYINDVKNYYTEIINRNNLFSLLDRGQDECKIKIQPKERGELVIKIRNDENAETCIINFFLSLSKYEEFLRKDYEEKFNTYGNPARKNHFIFIDGLTKEITLFKQFSLRFFILNIIFLVFISLLINFFRHEKNLF